jgi:hypothetical protein
MEQTLFHYFEKIAGHFRMSSWRESVANRNELIRLTAVGMLDNGIADVERVKKALRRRVGYYQMEAADQLLFRKHTSYLKKIVAGWHLVSTADQVAFRTGAIPPSTVVLRIGAARKAALA